MSTERVGAGSGKGIAGAIAAVLGVGLVVLIGLRVKDTVADRKAMTQALAEQVKAGGGEKAHASASTVQGKPKRWRPVIPLTGTLAPVQEADVGFKTGGRLIRVQVKVGDRIKAGQPLASLDVAEASAQAAATSAGVRAAQVNYDMAKDAQKRTLALFEQHAVSDAENLAATNRAALALAQLEQARAQAQLASVGLSNGSLAAPFSGLVTRAPDGIGKIVAPGEPMFHLQDTSILKLTATLSEADARLIELGADVSIDSVSAEAAPVEGKQGKQEGAARGKITAILASLDPQTRRVPVHAEIANDGASPLLAGAFVRATITSSKEITVLELPPGTIRPGSQDEVVVVEKGKARLARVAFTPGPGGVIYVRSGLGASDSILMNPTSEVRDGDDLGGAAH